LWGSCAARRRRAIAINASRRGEGGRSRIRISSRCNAAGGNEASFCKSPSRSLTPAYYHGVVDRQTLLLEFLQKPNAASLNDAVEELEDWPEAARLQKLAARAVFVEDDRLQSILDEAVREARRLLEAEE